MEDGSSMDPLASPYKSTKDVYEDMYSHRLDLLSRSIGN